MLQMRHGTHIFLLNFESNYEKNVKIPGIYTMGKFSKNNIKTNTGLERLRHSFHQFENQLGQVI